MLYKVYFDAAPAYLACTNVQSKVKKHHYLGNIDNNLFNSPIYIFANIIKNVMVLAVEVEVT